MQDRPDSPTVLAYLFRICEALQLLLSPKDVYRAYVLADKQSVAVPGTVI